MTAAPGLPASIENDQSHIEGGRSGRHDRVTMQRMISRMALILVMLGTRPAAAQVQIRLGDTAHTL